MPGVQQRRVIYITLCPNLYGRATCVRTAIFFIYHFLVNAIIQLLPPPLFSCRRLIV